MRAALLTASILLCVPTAGSATDLYAAQPWSSLAGDQVAHKLGDVITVVVDENSTATDTAASNLSKSSSLQGQVSGGTNFSQGGALALSDGSNNSGTVQRSGSMVAQMTALIDQIYPNGDLHVTGAEELNINGEKTHIRVQGRVRLADVSSTNSVLSSRLANAQIDYDGSGFVSRSAEPGIITRALNWLGLP